MNSGTRQLSRFNQKPRIAIIRSSMCRRCLTTISCRVDACTTGSKQKQIASLVAEQMERANPTASSTALGSEGKPTWQWQRITHLDCFKLMLQSFSQKTHQGSWLWPKGHINDNNGQPHSFSQTPTLIFVNWSIKCVQAQVCLKKD